MADTKEFDKQAALKKANAQIAAVVATLKELSENEEQHGYSSTGAAADKMLAKANVLWRDIYRWKRHGDYAAAMQTAGTR